MKKYLPTIGVLLVLATIVLSQSLFTVYETEKAILLQLGKPLDGVLEPGLHMKLPFIQNVLYLDARILVYDTHPTEALTSDKKAIVLDNFVRWRIVDPLIFYQTQRTKANAQARIEDTVYSQMRAMVGNNTLTEVVSAKRNYIMTQVTQSSSELVHEYGIEIIDVRIKRTDLPQENQLAIFGRMRAEREQQARQYRSEGQEKSTEIMSQADRERVILLAEAQRKADELRGEGDAEAIRIFAEALQQDPVFYEFQRTLKAYQNGLSNNTRIILSTDESFFKYLQ